MSTRVAIFPAPRLGSISRFFLWVVFLAGGLVGPFLIGWQAMLIWALLILGARIVGGILLGDTSRVLRAGGYLCVVVFYLLTAVFYVFGLFCSLIVITLLMSGSSERQTR